MAIINFDNTPNAKFAQRICANQIRVSQDIQLLQAHLVVMSTYEVIALDLGCADAVEAQALYNALVALKVDTDAAMTKIMAFYGKLQA